MNKKVVTFVVAMVLLLGVTIGVTFALMTAQTKSITNTFVAGGFGELDLWEMPVNGTEYSKASDSFTGNTYEDVVPGAEITKNAKVTFIPDNENTGAYIYVKISDENWKTDDGAAFYNYFVEGSTTEFMSFSWIGAGWSYFYEGNENDSCVVMYKEVTSYSTVGEDKVFEEQFIDQVVVSNAVTDTQLETLASKSLTFTAYAIQAIEGGDPKTLFLNEDWDS